MLNYLFKIMIYISEFRIVPLEQTIFRYIIFIWL